MESRILRPAAAARYIGLSRATVYRLERAGVLPPRILLGPGASGWLLADLDAFIDSRPRAPRHGVPEGRAE
jgi:predicted DNA-binding transcriptional regulator AlpA